MLGQQTLSAVNCQLPKEASKLALNKGNNLTKWRGVVLFVQNPSIFLNPVL